MSIQKPPRCWRTRAAAFPEEPKTVQALWYHLRSAVSNVGAIFVPIFKEVCMKSIAIYCRVSTQEQAAEGYSIGEQQARLSKFCEAHGWKIAHVYSDPGFSGAKLQRPAIQQLIRDCSYGLFDSVLVYKLDRLSRSQKDTLYLIEDVFNANHVGLVSMCENFDTQSPFGKAMIGILSVFAQLERDQITERMTMGRIGRAKAGYFAGGSKAPIGYTYVKAAGSDKATLTVDEYEAAQVRKVFSLFLESDMTFKEIARYMHAHYQNKYGDWSHVSTVSRMLRDRIYVGDVSFSGAWYKGVHQPIIDQDTFDRAQRKYDLYLGTAAGTFSQNFHGSQLLTGMIYCGECGGRCQCRSWRNHGKHAAPDSPVKRAYYCVGGDAVRIRVPELDSRVVGEVRKLSLDPDLIRRAAAPAAASPSSDDAKAIRSRLADLRKQEGKLVDLYQIGGIDLDMIKSRMDDLHREQEQLSASLMENTGSHASLSADDAIDALSSFEDVFSSGSLQDKRQILRTLIRRIDVFPDHVDIAWNFSAK